MCGIAGFYQWRRMTAAPSAHIKEMCGMLVHRGPDDEGEFIGDGVTLGMRRLSIIDVEGGRQPITNEDGSVVVVFNGEIYNYRTLRRDLESRGHRFRTQSDTEVIVHAYEDDGPACLDRFNGIFAFALWDARARRLLLARDRMGIKPLYYVQAGTGLAFASEIKALLVLPGVDRRLDPEAAATFFRLGFVPAPRTLFEGIAKIPPGHRLVAEAGTGRATLEPYWDMHFAPDRRWAGFTECREELLATLQQAVADQMVSDVPIGAFLSGGVDSSAIVALMQRVATGPVRTYSIGFDDAHAYHNEAPYAEAVARHLGTRHETLIVRPRVMDLMSTLIEKLDEPLTDTSFLVTYLISELAGREVKVALSGVGGDELFGGYRRYLAPVLARTMAWIPRGARRLVGRTVAHWVPADRGSSLGNLGRYAKAWGRTLHLPMGEQYLELVSVLSPDLVATLLSRGGTVERDGGDLARLFERAAPAAPLHRLLYVDAKTVLPESLLLLTDKMGMAASLEVRVPFLDNRVVDLVCRIPAHHHIRGLSLKRLLRAALRGVVPDLALDRSKRGFGTPVGTWLRTDLKPMVADLLGDSRLRRDGWLDGGVVRHILAAHETGREDYSEAIVALLTFQLWRDRFKVAAP
jgi:asparagine synthase (glutamine-hydrolysing)